MVRATTEKHENYLKILHLVISTVIKFFSTENRQYLEPQTYSSAITADFCRAWIVD